MIRLATLDDVAAVLAMMVDFNRFEGIAWSTEGGEAPLRKLVADPSLGVVGVVEERGAIEGYFVLTWGFDLEWGGRDAFLTELWLVEGTRGGGAGKRLLAEVERVAKEHGANALHLMVRTENARAQNLYLGAGYASPARIFMSKVLA